MAQAKPACGSHPHDCNADVLSIQYNAIHSVVCALYVDGIPVDLMAHSFLHQQFATA